MAVGDLIRAAESGGDPNARNPNSSASGPDQFLDRTWLDTIKAARPDLAGQPDSALLGLKTDPEISGQVRDAYAAQNGSILSKAGLPVTPGTTYLAHFAGPGGAVGLLNADPTTPAVAVLGERVLKANPFLNNKTAGDVIAWADRKMGGAAASPVVAPMSFGGAQQSTAKAPVVSDKPSEATAPWLISAPEQPQQPQAAQMQPAATMQPPAPFALLPPPKKIDLAQVYANLRKG